MIFASIRAGRLLAVWLGLTLRVDHPALTSIRYCREGFIAEHKLRSIAHDHLDTGFAPIAAAVLAESC